ncbi:hypothetical protein G195_001732 [Phytophthora kernoviae 00238/432]|uniref:Polyvalent protein metallopeptidase domain-containing protein n=1 Tax=Phytophthora kernoviae 00238/432 TaxID=1284355 RepID=A0A8J4WHD6_9STRA|nr:hypothetical protein G195_001732 [Phytophthora kernoviae 00238/432]
MLLDPGEYATFKQNAETGEEEKVPLLRYYKVFNIAECTGLESKRAAASPIDQDPIEDAERLVSGYTDRPPIRYPSGRAFYRLSEDVVSVPPLVDYQQAEEYYCTLFHELVHSTGHSKRLKRPLDEIAAFGDEVYSREELIAEMGAAMLCGVAKIDNHTIENSASYISGWVVRKIQEDDKRLVVQAAGIAQLVVEGQELVPITEMDKHMFPLPITLISNWWYPPR